LISTLGAIGVLAPGLAGPAAASVVKPASQHAPVVFPRFQSLYVPMPDGVRLAVDVWLPAGTTRASRLPTVLEADRYWRAPAYSGGIKDNANYYIATPWNERGYVYVFADLPGTGASFGTVQAELGHAMIADVGGLADWVAAQPWSDGRVGTTGVSYAGDAAMLSLALRNHHITAAAPISYDFDPYEDLLRPGGVLVEPLVAPYSTLLRVLDGTGGTTCTTSAETRQICEAAGLAGASPEPVQGPEGEALLRAARAGHRGNVNLVDLATSGVYRDYSSGQQSWAVTSVGDHLSAIEAGGVPILTFAGWLDAGTANGVLSEFTSLSNTQEDWIGPWSHGQGYFADPFKPSRLLTAAEHQQLNDVLYAFFDRYVRDDDRPSGGRVLHYYTFNEGTWRTTTRWPVAGSEVRRLYLAGGHVLTAQPPALTDSATSSDTVRLDPTAGSGPLNRWNTNLTGDPVVYPNRAGVDRKLLTYTTAPLRQATLVTGTPRVTLQVTGIKGASNGAIFTYLEDVSPDGRVTYLTEGDLALVDRAQVPARDNPDWAKLRTPRSYDKTDASPFPEGKAEALTFDLLPTSALFRAGDRIRLAFAGADPNAFQLLPSDGEAIYRIGHPASAPSSLDLPVVGACSLCSG
jgi:uncharacterized protein